MTTNRPRRFSKRLRAFVLAALVLLALVELVWVVGVDWALSSEAVAERVNRRPERLRAEWDGGHSLIPGRITVEGVTACGQTRNQQWYLELDRATVHLSLSALLRKTLKTYSVRASGIDFRVRKRLVAGADPPPTAEHWPPIPGLEPDAPAPEPWPRRGERPWVIVADGVRVEGIRQAWLLHYRLAAEGTVRADARIETRRGPIRVDRAAAALEDAEIFARGSRIGHGLRIDAEATVDPFRPAETRGLEVWGAISGSTTLAGSYVAPDLLNRMLPGSGTIEIGDSGGTISGELRVGSGKVLAGSHVELVPRDGWLRVLDWRARGTVDARFEVGAAQSDPSRLILTLEGVDVIEEGADLPGLEGAAVALEAAGRQLDLAAGLAGVTAALTAVDVDLEGATVADITRFPIPPVEDFHLDSGRVVVESHASLRGDAAEMRLLATGEGIGATYGDMPIVGDLRIELRAASPALRSRRFTVGPSSLRIDNVTLGEGEKAQRGWYAHLDIREGALSLAEPKEIGGAVDLELRDSRPIIALLQHRRPLIGKLKRILDFTDLQGTASVSAAADGLVVQEVDLAGDGLHVMARMRVAGSRARGILYTRFHGIPFGVDLRREKADLVFRRPKRWYEAQEPFTDRLPDG